jgi:hypothetical protein
VHDGVQQGVVLDDAFRAAARAAAAGGMMRSPRSGFTAYFHEVAEIPAEFAEAGLAEVRHYGLEGAF